MRFGDRRKEIAFALTLLVSVPACLIAAELAYRVVRDDYADMGFDWAEFRAVAFQPTLPDEREQFVPSVDYRHIHINAHGFRGPEIVQPKPAGTVRLAFVGNSKMLSASLPEAQTIAAQTVQRLREAYPECRFDYVVGAGPNYSVVMIEDVIEEELRALEPDIYVLMTFTTLDVLAAHERISEEPFGYFDERPEIASYSHLWGRLYDSFHLIRERRRAAEIDLEAVLPDSVIETMVRQMMRDLTDAMGVAVVINIAPHTSLRRDLSPDEEAWASREVLMRLRGIEIEDLLRLSEVTAAELERSAATFGWTHIDPIAHVPGGFDYYRDPYHFNELGTAVVAEHTAPAIERVIATRSIGGC